MHRLVKILVVMLVAAATVRAQEKTPFLRFEIDSQCRDFGMVRFIVNGNDRTPVKRVTLVGPLTWTAVLDTKILATGSFASARLGGSRTNCVRSVGQRKDGNVEAFFKLKCNENAAWSVKTETEPHRRFGYLRYLDGYVEQNDDPDTIGTWTTYDVRLGRKEETINLRLDHSLLIHLNSVPIFVRPKEGVGAQQTLERNQIVEEVARSTFGEQLSLSARAAIRTKQTIKELDSIRLTLLVK